MAAPDITKKEHWFLRFIGIYSNRSFELLENPKRVVVKSTQESYWSYKVKVVSEDKYFLHIKWKTIKHPIN